MTMAPLVAGGVLITGIVGGEYGIRGFIDGWRPRRASICGGATPSRRRANLAARPGRVDTWQKGGGSTWLTGSYDPDLDLVYWGTGDGGPWNAEFHKGDNLYICSVLAIRPSTGQIVWHYQFSPNDPYDHDGVSELVQADLKVEGRDRKVATTCANYRTTRTTASSRP